MTQTPNPTDGKLTEAEIEEIRNGPPGAFDYVQKLCDMALESLKAPAVTEKDSLIDALGTQIDGLYDDIRKAIDELGDPTPCPAPIYQARKILLYALMNGQCPPCDMGENTECVCPAPAPLSSEAVGKVKLDKWEAVPLRCLQKSLPKAEIESILEVCRLDIKAGEQGHGELRIRTWTLAQLCYQALLTPSPKAQGKDVGVTHD